MQLGQRQAGRTDLEDAKVGDDHVHHRLAGDGQAALLEYLGRPVAGGVFHQHDDPPHARNQVHRAAGSLDHFSGHHPVREIAVLRDFERPKDRQIDVAAAYHRERIRA